MHSSREEQYSSILYLLGDNIKIAMDKYHIKATDITRAISRQLSLSEITLQSHISHMKKGTAHYYYLPEEIRSETDTKKLERLALILYTLKTSENDDLIGKLEGYYNGQFVYPPKKSNPRRSIEKNLKKLKPEDMEWVQRLIYTIITGYESQ